MPPPAPPCLDSAVILACPACGARYKLADDAIPPGGRSVRCAACQHNWLELPAPEPEVPLRADPLVPAAAASPVAPRPMPEPEPDAEDEPRPPRTWHKWLFAILLGTLFALLSAALWTQQWGSLDVARLPLLGPYLAPPPATAAAATPLQLRYTAERSALANGTLLMAVSGAVTNPTGSRVAVPPLRAELRDDAGRIGYSWRIAAPVAVLPPRHSAAFDTSVSNFPAAATHLSLAFDTAR